MLLLKTLMEKSSQMRGISWQNAWNRDGKPNLRI